MDYLHPDPPVPDGRPMSLDERKSAIIRMFSAPGDLPERRTYVCLGMSRGGTSAVAGIVRRLGIFMGNDLPKNYEDPEFVGRSAGEMKRTVARRNAEHAVWGWKFPGAANYLESLRADLVNPQLLIVHRDMAATMKALMRWHLRSPQLAAHEILMQLQRNWFLAERWQVPTLMISYEKAITEPQRFVVEMAELLGRPEPDAEARAALTAFLAPGSYK